MAFHCWQHNLLVITFEVRETIIIYSVWFVKNVRVGAIAQVNTSMMMKEIGYGLYIFHIYTSICLTVKIPLRIKKNFNVRSHFDYRTELLGYAKHIKNGQTYSALFTIRTDGRKCMRSTLDIDKKITSAYSDCEQDGVNWIERKELKAINPSIESNSSETIPAK